MAKSRPLLERLLNAPDLANIVPHLGPEVLHRVIQTYGLEDCAELVALATPDQLARVLDDDIWRVRSTGDEALDADRFGAWIEVLMQSGAAVAAQKLAGINFDLVIAGFAQHTAVFDHAAVSSFMTLDGDLMPGRVFDGALVSEIGGYVIQAKRTTAWDAIVDLLVFLESEQADYFHRLMRGCVRLSNGAREADGFHHLLDDADQQMFDVASDRGARREKSGYVTPAQARAFLQTARQLPLDAEQPPVSVVARAYFRAIDMPSVSEGDPPASLGSDAPGSIAQAGSSMDPDTIVWVGDALREAGILAAEPRALLEAGTGQTPRLRLVHAFLESPSANVEALAFLGNAMVEGCSIQARPFTPREASEAVAAICNLGLDNWPHRWRDRDLVSAFQVGWTVLHRDVCMYAAERLVDVLADVRCRDREIHMRLNALRRELMQHVRDGAPWRARNAMDVVLTLDAPSWATLLALLDECPVMHAAIDASLGRSRRAIRPDEFTFISENRQIATVREFMKQLPSALTR
jgi:hypothetical protein